MSKEDKGTTVYKYENNRLYVTVMKDQEGRCKSFGTWPNINAKKIDSNGVRGAYPILDLALLEKAARIWKTKKGKTLIEKARQVKAELDKMREGRSNEEAQKMHEDAGNEARKRFSDWKKENPRPERSVGTQQSWVDYDRETQKEIGHREWASNVYEYHMRAAKYYHIKDWKALEAVPSQIREGGDDPVDVWLSAIPKEVIKEAKKWDKGRQFRVLVMLSRRPDFMNILQNNKNYAILILNAEATEFAYEWNKKLLTNRIKIGDTFPNYIKETAIEAAASRPPRWLESFSRTMSQVKYLERDNAEALTGLPKYESAWKTKTWLQCALKMIDMPLRAMLKFAGGSGSKAQVRTLRRVENLSDVFKRTESFKVLPLSRFVLTELDNKMWHTKPSISGSSIRTMIGYRDGFAEYADVEFLPSFIDTIETERSASFRVKDCGRMAKTIKKDSGEQYPKKIKLGSMESIDRAHDRLVRMVNRLESDRDRRPLPEGVLPDQEDELGQILSIKTGGELKAEGRVMGHCVGGYYEPCAEGRSFIYHVRHKDEQATLELVSAGTTGWRIGQLYGKYNCHVTDEMKAYVDRWAAKNRIGAKRIGSTLVHDIPGAVIGRAAGKYIYDRDVIEKFYDGHKGGLKAIYDIMEDRYVN